MHLIECPRDAMQGIQALIPTQTKIAYLNQLLKVGFHTLDFGSFVSPKVIPQMHDTAEVLAQLDLTHTNTQLLAIVANLRGATQACSFTEISYLGFPMSISETFQQRNTNKTISESLAELAEIQAICLKNNKQLVVYISMGFGNPYDDAYSPEIVLAFAEKLAQMQVAVISLADTVGVATPASITWLCEAIIPNLSAAQIEVGVHLHSSPATALPKIEAAYKAGCRRFDGALLGIGGCPMAKDELVGNMDTSLIIQYLLQQQAVEVTLEQNQLAESLLMAKEIFEKYH